MTDVIQTVDQVETETRLRRANPFLSPRGFIVMFVVLGILAVLGWGLANSTATRPEVGANAPDFEMEYFDGYGWESRSAANLSDMEGNVVVLNFWASWCVECKLEADFLEASWRKYRDQGVMFVGIDFVDTEPRAYEYMDLYDITYPNAPDLRGKISDTYKITGVPETFIIDQEGVIQQIYVGPINEQMLAAVVDPLLE
jgi:cytochrome c biogenesis protein CcmG/thiol:disulfide interchange protein DsbE